MFVVKTLYNIEDVGIGSDVELFKCVPSANNYALNEKETFIKEYYPSKNQSLAKDETDFNETYINGLYKCTIEDGYSFWSVTVEEKTFLNDIY
ncbi:hypothetical protein ACFVIX_06200 [Bacillus subtilis]|uniref:hypothetical protein n=1 Tax=Bacillus subtilis group TaxID=653685 RepID=UPI00080C9F52|nr:MULTISPECIES: hypothetical protein [Bacillus subtilis group]MCB4339398.1 hypothetical protein [Bacillus subtilis]MEC0393105.1 hypothetical protein [Bacillus subtilis]MEC0398586.1 hypothetical protein [Bacillus subtilis]MEC0436867.1 hypothetical protein [Bacillus subtilis]OCB94456.1 hypothetical protein SRCM101294_02666 [Bacillus amyloliquefaciens]